MTKLNQKIVNSLRPGPRGFVWDDGLKGFGLRITEGSIAYIVDFRVSARRRRVVIGATSVVTFQGARDRAMEVLAGATKGLDLTVSDRDGMPTFDQLWRTMLEDVDRPKLSAATIADYEDRARRLILPKIGRKLVCDVTQADVDKVLASTTGERNRAYVATLIKKTINHAKRARILPDSHRNPAVDVIVKKAPKRGRALEASEIAAFGEALAEMEDRMAISPWLANLFRLSLICGLRPGEVRTLTWDRVHLPRRKMTVVGKTGAREIHLTEAAAAVLETTPKVQGCSFVFAGRRFAQPIVGVHKVLRAVQDKAGVQHFRPYDFRHSAATGALAGGADVRAVQALLGHADLKTTSTYLHVNEDRRRAAAERAAHFGRGVLKNG